MNRLNTLSDAVATHARLRPHKTALRDSRRSLSFAQWHARSEKLAAGLLSLGLKKGDRVALLAYNCIEWMEIYAALARCGLVAVPLNFRLNTAEIAYIAEHSQARAFIVQDALRHLVEPLRQSALPTTPIWISFGEAAQTHWHAYEDLIAAAPPSVTPEAVLAQDMSALMYTSGTTGRPKGAIRSHEGSTLMALATALEMQFSSADTALIVMPLCHANSLYFSHTFAHLGACIVIDDSKSFQPEALMEKLASQ